MKLPIEKLGQEAQSAIEVQESEIRDFMREICSIPSMDGQIEEVAARVEEELEILGYEEVVYDRMGCLLASVGEGPNTILYDAHLDTVGIGHQSDWGWDPFHGKIEGDLFFARGACDTKGCIPGMVYGLALAHRLGLLEGVRAYFYGSLEEQCDGLAPRVLVEEEGVRPDYVVIGEPTNMGVYLGQRGRVEIEIDVRGRSAHASMPKEGDNPLYKLAQVITRIRDLDERLSTRETRLGPGSIAATDLRCTTASINAIPSSCALYLDRRLGYGEGVEEVLAEVRGCIPSGFESDMELRVLKYDEPSYTGYTYVVDKIFPAWLMSTDHPYVRAALNASRMAYGHEAPTDTWPASTNGTYWMGVAGIPSIGFGPGELRFAHSLHEHVSLRDVVRATAFYAVLPAFLLG
jgi:putative selenium metabolism hydrolase